MYKSDMMTVNGEEIESTRSSQQIIHCISHTYNSYLLLGAERKWGSHSEREK